MPRENVKKIRIPIEESVVTFGSGYEIGPRLRVCSNVVHNYIRASSLPAFPFGPPNLPSLDTAVSLVPTLPDTGPVTNPSGMGSWLSKDGLSHYWVVADVAGGLRRIFDAESGQSLTFDVYWGNQVGLPSFAFAPNIFVPITFVTIPGVAKLKQIREVVPGSDVFIAESYLPSFDPGTLPNHPTAPNQLYYHLNRLWLAYILSNSRRSLVYFSDPLNTGVIRANNFLDVPDHTTVIFRASASDVDLGSQAHLIIGCRSTIHILDGDPTQGNAVFRQLKRTFGIRRSSHVAETSEGACFLATDNLIYLMPRGGTEPLPISGLVRDKFNSLDPPVILGWRYPYLYVFDASSARIWLGDLGNPQQGVYWSGPHSTSTVFNISGFVADHPFEFDKVFVAITDLSDSSAKVAKITDSSFQNDTQVMETGYIFEQDADVAFKRAIFDFRRPANTQRVYKLTATNNNGISSECEFAIPPIPSPSGVNDIFKKLVVLPKPVVGDFFFLRLESMDPPFLGNLHALRNWNLEYRVFPRKD